MTNGRTSMHMRWGLVLVITLVALLALGGCSSSSSQSSKAAEPASSSAQATTQQTGSTTAKAEAETTVGKEVAGWWQTLGQSGSVYHHFGNGVDYVYQQDLENQSKFSFSTKSAIKSVKSFSPGDYAEINESGIIVSLSGGATYFMMNSDPKVLQSRYSNGGGYSASSSLVKIDAPPANLSTLANETESSL